MQYSCTHTRTHTHTHTEAVNKTCENGDVRLAGGGREREGRVELCINSRWGTVCGVQWDNRDASVVCRQLGFESETTSKRSRLREIEGDDGEGGVRRGVVGSMG